MSDPTTARTLTEAEMDEIGKRNDERRARIEQAEAFLALLAKVDAAGVE